MCSALVRGVEFQTALLGPNAGRLQWSVTSETERSVKKTHGITFSWISTSSRRHPNIWGSDVSRPVARRKAGTGASRLRPLPNHISIHILRVSSSMLLRGAQEAMARFPFTLQSAMLSDSPMRRRQAPQEGSGRPEYMLMKDLQKACTGKTTSGESFGKRRVPSVRPSVRQRILDRACIERTFSCRGYTRKTTTTTSKPVRTQTRQRRLLQLK
mmetsp:Transcript_145944/g.467889  ORF Transcript_145944/g.467889 Transcript_145944/m.467889 type:complete len:213 (-) Transcript_145944:1422-2060(-)